MSERKCRKCGHDEYDHKTEAWCEGGDCGCAWFEPPAPPPLRAETPPGAAEPYTPAELRDLREVTLIHIETGQWSDERIARAYRAQVPRLLATIEAARLSALEAAAQLCCERAVWREKMGSPEGAAAAYDCARRLRALIDATPERPGEETK